MSDRVDVTSDRVDVTSDRCLDCGIAGCKGQCDCPCNGCKTTPINIWVQPQHCDIVKEFRALREPGGRERARAAYHQQVADARNQRKPSWAECGKAVRRLGVPSVTMDAASRPRDSAAKDEAHFWLKEARSKSPGLVFCGSTGVGKSVAAAWLCMRWGEMRPWWKDQPSGPNRQGACWIYCPTIQALTMLRDEDSALLHEATRCELLVLDEVTLEMATAGGAAFKSLVARRLDSGLPFIITTNLSQTSLATALGDNIKNRLLASAYMPKLDAESKRPNLSATLQKLRSEAR